MTGRRTAAGMKAESLTVRAAAKINVHLGVGAPRVDGFHPLDTVYQAVSLHDDVRISAATTTRLRVRLADHVTGSVPTGSQNLILRAAGLLAAHHRREVPVDVTLDKSIPIAGGMAGGSADAAAALVALDRWHALHTGDAGLLAMAAELGSDVPFGLVGGTARGLGRGEKITRVDDHGSWWWVVVPASVGLSTPLVYRRYDELRPDAPAVPASSMTLIEALSTREPLRLARALHNDLEEAAIDLRPELGDLIDRGAAAGALRGMVSGSGPSVVFLTEGRLAAEELAHELRAHYDVVLVVNGPVAGAHVVAAELL